MNKFLAIAGLLSLLIALAIGENEKKYHQEGEDRVKEELHSTKPGGEPGTAGKANTRANVGNDADTGRENIDLNNVASNSFDNVIIPNDLAFPENPTAVAS